MTVLAVHPIVTALAPEIVLVLGGVVILLVGLHKAKTAANSLAGLGLVTISVALLVAWRLRLSADVSPPVPELRSDGLLVYARLVGLTVGLLVLMVNRHVPGDERGEFFALLLFSLAGVLMVAAANDLILLFLALELVSVPTYIMIGLSRQNIRAQEATAKYFFLGAFAAALTLYGFSFLYGAAGTTRLFGSAASADSLATALSRPMTSGGDLVRIGVVLSLAGLAFKIAAVPFHFYVADVYQGAASGVAGLLGFVPKFAGLLALVRVLSVCGWPAGQRAAGTDDALFWLLWVMAAATMFVGNTLALMQHNVKRMLAYSSIAHAGYMLVALVAGPGPTGAGESGAGLWRVLGAAPLRDGVGAALFYMAVYGVMNLGAFAALAYFRKPGGEGDDSVEMLDDLAGAGRRYPWASLALAICVLGLMGFPFTAGFLGKVYVFSAALSAGEGAAGRPAMVALVVIGVVNSAIGAAYYLRILGACYMGRPAEGVAPSRCGMLRLALAACAAIVLAVFFRPGVLLNQSRWAAANAVTAASPAASSPAGHQGRDVDARTAVVGRAVQGP